MSVQSVEGTDIEGVKRRVQSTVQTRVSGTIDIAVQRYPGGGILFQVDAGDSNGIVRAKPVLVDGSNEWVLRFTGPLFES